MFKTREPYQPEIGQEVSDEPEIKSGEVYPV